MVRVLIELFELLLYHAGFLGSAHHRAAHDHLHSLLQVLLFKREFHGIGSVLGFFAFLGHRLHKHALQNTAASTTLVLVGLGQGSI